MAPGRDAALDCARVTSPIRAAQRQRHQHRAEPAHRGPRRAAPRRAVCGPRGARAAPAVRTADRERPRLDPAEPHEVVDGGGDDVAREPSARAHLVQRGDSALERREHRRQGPSVHQNNRPTWNTRTDSTQAAISPIPTPSTVHFIPISRFWAANVATHGV